MTTRTNKPVNELISTLGRLELKCFSRIIDRHNVSTNFSLEDGKLAIDSISHHPFTQQTEELKEGFKVARWSYNPTEKTIAFWKAA